jgi:hypothetical protein
MIRTHLRFFSGASFPCLPLLRPVAMPLFPFKLGIYQEPIPCLSYPLYGVDE